MTCASDHEIVMFLDSYKRERPWVCKWILSKMLSGLNGVFAVNKPAGISSAAVVSRVKHYIMSNFKLVVKERSKLFKRLKVGHGGTLDPLASGVLVIGMGDGCKQLANFLKGPKSYRATAKFGLHYDTLDITGNLLFTDKNPPALSNQKLEEACKKWVGEILQKPPAYSALKINGKRAYEISRKKTRKATEDMEDNNIPPTELEPIDMPARPVKVYSIEVEKIEDDMVVFKMDVGGGVYVRSLIRDIAKELGTVAVMTDLTRTRQGTFSLPKALEIEDCNDLGKVRTVLEGSRVKHEESPHLEPYMTDEQTN